MRWLLPWTLAAVAVLRVGNILATALSPTPTTMTFTPAPLEETTTRPEFCKWP
nr:Wisp1 protein [Mus musculus]